MPPRCADPKPAGRLSYPGLDRPPARCPVSRRLGVVGCSLLLLAWHPGANAGADPEYLAQLIERSRQLGLAQRPEWLKLMHYEPRLLGGGVDGLVESPDFYNAPGGRSDPQAELQATLASFFSDLAETDRSQNPQCRFIARFDWLDRQLVFDPARLPRRTCSRYRRWHESLNPAGITLVFASAYLNSPASMFGHTFLRIDARDQNETTRLLAYAVNFGADTRETGGIAFAINGLFGGYPGSFSMLPYYAKVRDYSDLENRDIWEYPLRLSAEEVDRVLMHAWEMGPVQFRYYFFDKNCSYQLLSLLQVARPGFDFTGRFHAWAIPADTVRVVAEQPDLVPLAVYRPANATVIRRRLARLDPAERSLTRDLALRRRSPDDADVTALAPPRAAAVIETSQDYLAYLRAIGGRGIERPGELAHDLAVARSRVDAGSQAPEVAPPTVRPDQGHDSARITAGAGRWAGRDFEEIGGRAAYQDILDPDGGYVRGAQIEFANLGVRHYGDSAPRLEYLVPLSVLSLSARDDFFRPWSWNVSTSWRRVAMGGAQQPLVFGLSGGAGGAWAADAGHVRVYGLLDAETRVARELAGDSQFGGGPMVGVLVDPASPWRIHAYAQAFRYFLGQLDARWRFGIEQRVTLHRDLALRADLDREHDFGRTYNAGSLSLQVYF